MHANLLNEGQPNWTKNRSLNVKKLKIMNLRLKLCLLNIGKKKKCSVSSYPYWFGSRQWRGTALEI